MENLKYLNLGPVKVAKLYTAEGNSHTAATYCVQYVDFNIFCWGLDLNGISGKGYYDYTKGREPTKDLDLLSPINFGKTDLTQSQFLMLEENACLHLKSGNIKCWGDNENLLSNNRPERLSLGSEKFDIEELNFIKFE